MAIDTRIPVVTTFLVLIATGCGPSIEADLSPDGRTLVQANQQGLTIRKTEGGASETLLKGAVGQPKFSPDGRTVAVERFGKSVQGLLVNVATKGAKPLPTGLRGPFAWRPDGTELLAWRGAVGQVYHLGSGTVVRQVPLPEGPTGVRWLPGGRDFVASSRNSVMIVHGGQVRRIETKDEVLGLGYDAARDRVIWSEGRAESEEAVRLNVFAVPRKGGERVALLSDADPAKLLKAPSPYALPVTLAVSPDGTRLAMAALVEPAPVGSWQRYVDLQKRARKRPTDNAIKGEINRLEKNLRFDLAIVTASVNGEGLTTVATRRDLREFAQAPENILWSPDGTRLAVVTRQGVEMLDAH